MSAEGMLDDALDTDDPVCCNCGIVNEDYNVYCLNCGADLTGNPDNGRLS